MLNIFKRNFLDKKWIILIYCIVAVTFLWMYVVFYPSVQESAANVSQLVKSLPESMIKSFGLDAKSFTTFEGFVAGKHFSIVWPILLIGLVNSLAGSFLAGEIEKGTIAVLLSQPISRTKIFLEKSLLGVTSLIFFIATSVLAVFPIAKAYKVTYHSLAFLKLALVGFAFGLAIFGLSMFFSAFFSEKSKVNFVVIGGLILMYFINIIAGIKTSLDKLKYFSFFHYFNYADILVLNKVNRISFLVFFGTFILSTVLGLFWFHKRDIAI